jgi:hypothetical protein
MRDSFLLDFLLDAFLQENNNKIIFQIIIIFPMKLITSKERTNSLANILYPNYFGKLRNTGKL